MRFGDMAYEASLLILPELNRLYRQTGTILTALTEPGLVPDFPYRGYFPVSSLVQSGKNILYYLL